MTLVFPAMTPRQQADAVVRTETTENERERRPGDRVALVSARWFSDWCAHTGCTYDAQQRRLLPPPDDAPDASGPAPGPLSSEGLLDAAAAAGDLSPAELSAAAPLLPGLKEKEDFWALHEATYNLLKEWYGEKSAPVVRQYLPVGTRLELNMYQWHIKVVNEHTGNEVMVPAVRHASVATLKGVCCAALDVDTDEVEIASFRGRTGTPKGLEDEQIKTLLGVGLTDRQAVLLRRKDHPESAASVAAASKRFALSTPTSSAPIATPGPAAAGALNTLAASTAVPMSVEGAALPPLLFPASGTGGSAGSTGVAAVGLTSFALGASVGGSLSPARQFAPLSAAATPPSDSPLSRSFGRAPLGAEDVSHPAPGRLPGLAGLGNLGNTCFMNSSLQCLVHSVPLMRAFLTGAYREDLNKDNPLGQGGKLAVAFGGLMAKLWRGDVASVAPKHFKWRLARFAPQFSGYAQQDSQELLAFLLDGLHEDLNRILDKPYREEKDAEGRPDADVAAEAWDNYRARNDSVAVDHFQGLLKSTLRCPECDRRSVKFDPFMYLSLPLPTAKTTTLIVTVVDISGAQAPLQIAVEVAKDGTVGDAVAAVAACADGDAGDGNAASPDSSSSRWLLAKWIPTAYSSDPKLELCADLEASVAVLEPPAQKRYFLTTPKHTLVAYRYPDAASGPGSCLRPTVVFHRADAKLAGVPAVFYLPITGASGTDDDSSGAEMTFEKVQIGGGGFGFFSGGTWRWALTPPSPLHAALEAFLRPFLKEGVDAAVLIAPPQPHEGAQQAMEDSTAAGAGAGAETASPPSRASASVGMDVDGEGVGMTSNAAFGSAVQLIAASDDDDMPTLVLPAVTAPTAAPALDENFNMLEPSTEESMPLADSLPDLIGAEAAAAAAEGGGAPAAEEQAPKEERPAAKPAPAAHPAVQLLLASKGAVLLPAGTSETAPYLASFSATPQPIFLNAEWDKAAAAALDLTPWTAPAQHASAVAAAAAAAAPPRPVSLDDCVDAFTQPERLDTSDSWYCTGCKSHVRAEKKLDLWRLPEILVVHLKRFSYSRSYRDKLDTPVDFPLEGLDLRHVVPAAEGGTLGAGGGDAAAAAPVDGSSASPPAPVYDLYAVSNHYGGMGGGHYTAYCRVPGTATWHSFDDSSVTGMDPAEVRSPAAYVLFYRRRGAEESDVPQIVDAAARRAADADDDDDVNLMIGGAGGSGSGHVVPALEQVAEEGEEEGDENTGPGAAAAAAAEEEERGPAAHAVFALDEEEDDTMAVDDI